MPRIEDPDPMNALPFNSQFTRFTPILYELMAPVHKFVKLNFENIYIIRKIIRSATGIPYTCNMYYVYV